MCAITVPTDALNQHVAVVGKTGSGKTFAAKGLIEGLLRAGLQVCIIDPTSAWWGLRLLADGKSKGFDVVILGGPHADIPLSERSGAAVARLVAEQGANVIIDTSLMTVGEYTRWFIEFGGSLYSLARTPLHLVIDEAHQFAPQGRVPDPQAGRMLHACNRLMSGGRSRGIRAMLITQRPAKLHKDSLSCADTLVAMRVIAPQDRQAIKDWIDGAGDPKQGKAILDSLAGLARGEGWVWYPEANYLERVKFPRISTFDSSATPVHGAAKIHVGAIDLTEIKQSIEEAIKEAEANDPKALRARIAQLEAAASAAPAAAPEAQQYIEILKQGLLQSHRTNDALSEHIKRLIDQRRLAQDVIAEIQSIIARYDGTRGAEGDTPTYAMQPATLPESAASPGTPAPTESTMHRASGAQQRILDAIAWFESIGVTAPSRNQVGLLANIKPTGGHFGNTIGPLSTGGLVAYPSGGTVTLTAAGRRAANTPARRLTLRDYHSQLMGLRFKNSKTADMLRVLIEHGNQPMTAKDLSKRVKINIDGGHFGNTVGPLGTLGLIVRRDGMVTPTALLFPEGLR